MFCQRLAESDGDVDILGRFSSNMMNELNSWIYHIPLVDSTQIIDTINHPEARTYVIEC